MIGVAIAALVLAKSIPNDLSWHAWCSSKLLNQLIHIFFFEKEVKL